MPRSSSPTRVLDPALLPKLDCLRLTVHSSSGTRPGNTPVSHGTQPSGLELTSYKIYTPGDDLRYLDWNAYGRLDQLLVKRFRPEVEAPLHLFVDTSSSMSFPEADGKLSFALTLAASLAYVSLRRLDPVRVIAVGTAQPMVSSLTRHLDHLPQISSFLGSLETRGSTKLRKGVEAYLRLTQLRGIAILISDFLVDPLDYQQALDLLRSRGYTVAAIRVIGAEEQSANRLPSRVRIRDAETGEERVLVLSAAHREKYALAVREHLGELKRWCESRDVFLAVADTQRGLEACLFEDLPRAGLLH
jgi:uncharacterized protein (DUF58 family)